MAKSTLTFELGGQVNLGRLEEGISVFRRLVSALTSSAEVTWIVEDLQPGSAIATVRGEADDLTMVENIVDRYGEIGKALERQEAPRGGLRIRQAVDAVRNLAASIEYVRFETPDADYTIYGHGKVLSQPATMSAIGTVTGRVQTLSNRAGLRFNLYESIFDKAVACYLTQGQEESMREAWDRRARVSGRVSREAVTGRPIAIRQIAKVEVLEDAAPGSYRLAKGAVPWQEGDLLPEEAVRRLRDA